MQKLLFICTSNMTRSPTCEDILRGSTLYETKSAGTAPHAVVRVTQEMIDWADTVFVMSERTDKHLTYLKEHFELGNKEVIDLDFPDFIYDTRGEPKLVAALREKLAQYLTL